MNAMLVPLLLYIGAACLGAVAAVAIGMPALFAYIRLIGGTWFMGIIILFPIVATFFGTVVGIGLRVVYQLAGLKIMGVVLGVVLGVLLAFYAMIMIPLYLREARRRRESEESLLEYYRMLRQERLEALPAHRDCIDRTMASAYRLPDGEIALMLAAQAGEDGLVRFLLERGVKPGRRNKRGQTPRMLAEKNGHKEVADLLSEAERLLPLLPLDRLPAP